MSDQTSLEFVVAGNEAEFAAAGQLFREYAASLDFDLCFQNFDQELREMAVQYHRPGGGLILARHGNSFVGCAGIRKLDDATGELKRMYLRPAFRGRGAGRKLLEKALDCAKDLGYRFVRLDTMKSMERALALYRLSGFYEIEVYRFNPGNDALYFEKKLGHGKMD